LAGTPSWGYDTVRLLDQIKAPEMQRPVAAAVHGQRLYVLDGKISGLLIFDLAGRLLKTVGRPGSGKSGFDSPRGIAVGPDGKVYVADTGNSRIQILDADGGFLWSFGTKGSERGMLREPRSVAVGAGGRIYVSDSGNDRVQVFTADGILLYGFGSSGKGPGQFSDPARIAVDPADNVYVLDSGHGRIEKFDPAARFVREYQLSGHDFGVDAYGFLYVLDADSGKVVEQSPDGAVLGRFGSSGSGMGQYRKPEGVTVVSDGTVLVLDTGNSRIQRIEVANKLKTAPLPPDLATKLLVSGPSRSWPVAAGLLAPYGDDLFAYLPKDGQFVRLDSEGKERARFGIKTGKEPSATRGARGLAVSRKLGLYVSDASANRIQQFTLDGVWKANIAESSGFFDSRKKEGRVKEPQGVAINEAGTIYVADAGNSRIDAFSPEGVFLFGFGPGIGTSALQSPAAVAWDKMRFLYFTDKELKKIFKVEPSGALIKSWGEEGEGPGQFRSPSAMAFDGNNYLYILDDVLRRVSVYTKDGKWMTDLFAPGAGERELSAPTAVAIQGERLLIADGGKGRIVTYDLHPHLTAPVSVSSSVKEGSVLLSWSAVSDPWTSAYRVLRSSDPGGPFEEIGRTEATRWQDDQVKPYSDYWYQVATEAKTQDVGPGSRPVAVYVTGAMNKAAVEISTVSIGNIFSANYKWYLKNPVGRVVLTNNVNTPFQNLKLTFRLKEFMDFGYDTEIKRLDPQQSVEVPVIATLNNRVLEVSEDTPVQAEFTLTYFESGKSQTVSLTRPLRVYSRNAITWEDPSRIANFITPKDPPVRDFQSEALRDRPRSAKSDFLNRNLVTALHIWDALSEAGVQFQSNPNNPYEALREDPNFPVDYSQFPRDTLKRKSGQCDDLATLIVSMLYGANVRAVILDYPGHMALMFDTESSDPLEIGLPESGLISYEGTYWVPLEATLAGKPFPEAYRKALYAYNTEQEKGRVRVTDPRRAWATYEPATLPESGWTAEVPKAEARQKRFDEEAGALAADRNQFLKKHYEAMAKAEGQAVEAHVQLGLLAYQQGDHPAAAAEFDKALAIDPSNAAALNDLGGLIFWAGDDARAHEQFLKAAAADPEDADIWLNLVKTAVRLQARAKAEEYGRKAAALEPDLGPVVKNLLDQVK
jgi:DNA-binding beta-propeller fold protein YncE/tetratricopeptide (TPR) repeat protein